MKLKLTLLLVFMFILNGQAQNNYYVSPTGNDSNNGTSTGTAWQTIQHAVYNTPPNSIVNIMAGTYNELVYIGTGGTAANPIIYQNYQNDVVTITGSGSTANYSNLIAIVDASYITIKGLILENLTGVGVNGVLIESNVSAANNVTDITLNNLTLRNIGYTTNAAATPSGGGDNAHGIQVYGQGTTAATAIKNIVIENCKVHNLVTGFSECVTINGNVDGFSILNNSIHDNTNIGISIEGNYGASGNATLDHARNGTVSGNITYNNISPVANSAGIYCDGCQNTLIERNTSHNNTVGIEVGCEQNGSTDNVTVKNNFVYSNNYTGIGVGGYTTSTTGIVNNSTINNNTCYHNGLNDGSAQGQIGISKTSNCQFFNNILYSDSDSNLLLFIDKITPESFTINYNEFYTTSGTVANAKVSDQWNTESYATYRTSTGNDVNSIFANPLLVNTSTLPFDIHLQSTSPSINAGDPSYTPTATEKDFYGNNRANGIVDIGAVEYNSSTLAVNKYTAKKMFSIFPNPSSNFITIQINKNIDGKQDFQFYNSIGQLVKEVTITNNASVNISNLPSGIYFIRLKNHVGLVYRFAKM